MSNSGNMMSENDHLRFNFLRMALTPFLAMICLIFKRSLLEVQLKIAGLKRQSRQNCRLDKMSKPLIYYMKDERIVVRKQ